MPAAKNPAAEATDLMKDAAKQAENFAADSQKLVAEQIEKLTKGFEKASEFNRESVDALMKSTEITAKAVEGLNAEIMDYSKKSFEESVAAAKELAGARNVTELFEKQADFARHSVDGFMKQAAKVNEMYLAAAKSAMEPISARFTAASEVFKGFTA